MCGRLRRSKAEATARFTSKEVAAPANAALGVQYPQSTTSPVASATRFESPSDVSGANSTIEESLATSEFTSRLLDAKRRAREGHERRE